VSDIYCSDRAVGNGDGVKQVWCEICGNLVDVKTGFAHLALNIHMREKHQGETHQLQLDMKG
jgi:hypothetical protein